MVVKVENGYFQVSKINAILHKLFLELCLAEFFYCAFFIFQKQDENMNYYCVLNVCEEKAFLEFFRKTTCFKAYKDELSSI